MSQRLSIPALVGGLALIALGLAYVLLLKPTKPSMRVYSIGEQGLAQSASGDKGYLSETVVANIGGYSVTAGEVEGALNQLPPFQRYYYSSPEQVEVFLQNYAMFLLLANKGSERGVGQDPYVRFVTEQALADHYKQVFLADAIKASDIPDAEVQAYLAEHRAELTAGQDRSISDNELATAAKAAILEARRNALWEQHLNSLR